MSSGTRPPLPLPRPRPSKRPAYYPESVLWTFADCKSDPSVGMSPGNESRPPMARAIRHENGELLSDDEWKTIRQSTITTMHSRLDSIDTSHLPPSATNQSHKKTFYTRYFMKEWLAALAELEVVVPLLSLCSGDWKADKMLASVLDKSANPGPPSRAPTPSYAPSSRASTPALTSVGSSRGAPYSRGPPSSVGNSSQLPRTSPRRAILKSAVRSRPLAGSNPGAAGNDAASKNKRRREPSPARTGKKSKGKVSFTSFLSVVLLMEHIGPAPSSPRPGFLGIVEAGAPPKVIFFCSYLTLADLICSPPHAPCAMFLGLAAGLHSTRGCKCPKHQCQDASWQDPAQGCTEAAGPS